MRHLRRSFLRLRQRLQHLRRSFLRLRRRMQHLRRSLLRLRQLRSFLLRAVLQEALRPAGQAPRQASLPQGLPLRFELLRSQLRLRAHLRLQLSSLPSLGQSKLAETNESIKSKPSRNRGLVLFLGLGLGRLRITGVQRAQ